MRVTMWMILISVLGFESSTAYAQSWQPPADSQRCPSKWGAGDQRGSGNHMKPDTGSTVAPIAIH